MDTSAENLLDGIALLTWRREHYQNHQVAKQPGVSRGSGGIAKLLHALTFAENRIRKLWSVSGHSPRSAGCANRCKSLINKGGRRKGPGGPIGLAKPAMTASLPRFRVLPPLAADGRCLLIRKFSPRQEVALLFVVDLGSPRTVDPVRWCARDASTAGLGSSRVLPPMNPGKTRCKPRVSRPIPLSNFVILFRRVAAVNRIAVAPLLLRCER
jgi:hypothetical protein